MPIPSQGFPLAAAVTPRLQVVESVDSTNAKLLHDAAADPDGHPHLSVVVTDDQRAGRGRLDRVWTAPAGTALAISALLRVGAVEIADRGWIPLIAGAAMRDAVAAQLGGKKGEARGAIRVSVKWPNDVIVGHSAGRGADHADGDGADGRKISGILTEVLPSDPLTVVVGAGVNTTMETVDLPVPTATSFADQGVEVDEDRLLADYLTALRDGIAALAVGGHAAIEESVSERCSTIGADVSVSLPGEHGVTTLRGRAVRLDADGRLVVESEGVETVVSVGDVVHVR